jgi:hypothetical protein
MSLRVSAVSLTLLLLSAATLRAQAVRGEVVDDGGRPVAAAFVILQDAAGTSVARALSDSAGGFVLRAGGPGTYTLRAERIGYASAVSPPLRLEEGAVLPYRMAVAGKAVALEAIVVGGATTCAVRARDDAAAAALWEEARKALAVSAWTERAESLHVVATEFARTLDRRGRKVVSEESRNYEGPTLNPFVTLAPEELARAGYRRVEGDVAWYYAPDALVLLSDGFLDTHCFHTERGRGATRGLLGLAFEPVRGRRVTDVAGTLWIDPRTAELRHLEFRYRNLPREDDWRGVGGRVEFRRLPTGAWIIERWYLRMPEVGRSFAGRMVLRGYRDVGGEVRSVSRQRPAADSAAAPSPEVR